MWSKAFPLGQAVGGGCCGFKKNDAGLGHVALKTTLQRERNARLSQLRRSFAAQVFSLVVRAIHRRVQEHGESAPLDVVDNERRVGYTVENDIELELRGEAERSENVLMSLHGDEERLIAIEHACEGFEAEVARGALFDIALFAFVDVVLGLDEFGAEHGDGFGGSAGRLVFVSLGTGTESSRSHGSRIDQRLLQVRGVRLDDHGLAGDERAGAVSRVDGGDPEAADVIDERIAAIVGVDGAKLGLKRCRFLQLLLIVRLVQDAGKSAASRRA